MHKPRNCSIKGASALLAAGLLFAQPAAVSAQTLSTSKELGTPTLATDTEPTPVADTPEASIPLDEVDISAEEKPLPLEPFVLKETETNSEATSVNLEEVNADMEETDTNLEATSADLAETNSSLEEGNSGTPTAQDSAPSNSLPFEGLDASEGSATEQLPTLTNLNNEDLFSDYLLGPGDQIQVLVIGYDEFQGPRVVLPDGTITMPLIGSVPAAGRTMETVSNEIRNRLSVYLTNPVVDANLTVLRPVVVNVVGEVYRPGPVQLSSLTTVNTTIRDNATLTNFTNTPTLSTALTTAGGIRRTADIRNVTILRRTPDGDLAEFEVNLWEALQGEDELGVLVMFDGDTVIVPEAPIDAEGLDQSLIASSSIAPTNVRVRVIGAVTQPGEVQIQPNSSISSAIAAAGGFDTETAALNRVKLVRLSQNGQVEEQEVDVSSLVDDYQIQDGDVVFVPKRGGVNLLDNIARIARPLLAPLGIIDLLDNLFFNNNNN
jgi:polysaccharide export outer membrane protein